MVGLGVAAALVPSLLARPPLIIWNATASAPEGLYAVHQAPVLAVGDLVAVAPQPALAEWLDRRGAAPEGVLLLKRVAALGPTRVCWTAGHVTLDGRVIADVRTHDRQGRSLPALQGCRRLLGDEIFLLNTAPGSLDGRYFGPLSRAAVVGQATPIWVKKGVGDDR
jgi:conjugative transfer signal peptidase TraF